MKVLFATGRLFLPERVAGGANHSAHTLLATLGDQGHACEALAVMRPGRRYQWLRVFRFLTRRRRSGLADHWNGYPTYRGLSPTWAFDGLVAERLRAFRPDVLITQLNRSEEITELALGLGVPTILRFCDVDFAFFTGRSVGRPFLSLSNSHFVAARLRERFGLDSEVLYPAIRVERYRAEQRNPEFVTLINPHKVKGIDLVLEVAARLPHRRFLLQESWPLKPDELAGLERRLAAVPNVTLSRVTRDMRTVYGRTRLLLVPSLWEEAFGRVIIEAHINGIPALATRVGGIPEALGAGGELFDTSAPAEAWVAAIERILSDPGLYAQLSEHGLANARRSEFEPARAAERFVRIAEEYVTRRRADASGRSR